MGVAEDEECYLEYVGTWMIYEDLVRLAQDREQWRVMKPTFSKKMAALDGDDETWKCFHLGCRRIIIRIYLLFSPPADVYHFSELLIALMIDSFLVFD